MNTRNITREDIAEIHESIAKRRAAQTEAEQKDQQWHHYAAAVIRENDVNVFSRHSHVTYPRQFTHSKHWLA